MRAPWHMIIAALALAGIAVLVYSVQSVRADEGYTPESLTIGVPHEIDRAFFCRNQEAATAIAKIIHEQDLATTLQNPTYLEYQKAGVCAWIGGVTVEPLSVPYHDTIYGTDAIIKVVVVATDPDHPSPKTNLYMVVANPIIGSGIVELHGAKGA